MHENVQLVFSCLIISPPENDSFRSGLIFCWHLFIFATRSLSSVDRSPRKFAPWWKVCSIK